MLLDCLDQERKIRDSQKEQETKGGYLIFIRNSWNEMLGNWGSVIFKCVKRVIFKEREKRKTSGERLRWYSRN